MGITVIIVGGIVIISVVAVVGDYITKAKSAQAKAAPTAIGGLADRIEALERQAQERDAKIERLEGDVAFTTRLLEGKRDGGA